MDSVFRGVFPEEGYIDLCATVQVTRKKCQTGSEEFAALATIRGFANLGSLYGTCARRHLGYS